MFLGGPPKRWRTVGRMCFDLLVANGLQPEHRLVDVGAGALRAGVWLVPYLDSGNYCALEPNRRMILHGIRNVDGPVVVDHNDRFDLSPFGVCDFGLARSIWTHASLSQIDQLCRSWKTWGAGPLFASYIPGETYRGDSWVGRSHRSDIAGTVTYRLADLKAVGADHQLAIEDIGGPVVGKQRWLRVE